MSADLPMRQATTEEDVEAVVALWNEAKDWLATKGTDQWQYPVRLDSIRQKVTEGAAWILDNDQGEPIATITLDEDADPRLWRPEDHPEDALYAHRLVVRRDHRGSELGALILAWAAHQAADQSKAFLRLDAWTTNTALHDYYRRRGFRPVRLVVASDVASGALFETVVPSTDRSGPQGWRPTIAPTAERDTGCSPPRTSRGTASPGHVP